MSTMDEILYWVHTKRAPCLMSYDSLKQPSSTTEASKPKSVASAKEETLVKKKKRKLSLLDDSASLEKRQNVYFETCKGQPRVAYSRKSETAESDIDFNIKNSYVWDKPKRIKLQKNSKTVLHKKNKVVTSTPNPKLTTAVRRSLRKILSNESKNGHLNSSMDDANVAEKSNVKSTPIKSVKRTKRGSAKVKYTDLVPSPDNAVYNNTKNEVLVLDRGFEDMSDVSGFTANYIRSTKVQRGKPQRNLRSKGSKALVKETQTNMNDSDNNIVMCVNKSTNPTSELPNLNCSSDPSNNIITLLTNKSQDKSDKVNKSTSVLKFLDGKSKSKEVLNLDITQSNSKSNLDSSFEINSSRYPRRHRSQYNVKESPRFALISKSAPDKRRKSGRSSCKFNDSERKENPEESYSTRTRSGRNAGLSLRQQENSVLVYSNSTEQESSVPNINVACQSNRKKRKPTLKCSPPLKKSTNKSGSFQIDSLRERSGFTACFSDSDQSEPSKRKFFC